MSESKNKVETEEMSWYKQGVAYDNRPWSKDKIYGQESKTVE